MVDFEQLRQDMKSLNTRQKLYKLLKEELSLLGYWKNKPRGKQDERYFKGKDYE